MNKTGLIRRFSFGLFALVLQGSLPSHAQNATTNSSPAVPIPTDSVAPPPDKIRPTFQDAVTLYDQGRQDEALSVLNTLLQNDPKNLNAYILRGGIYSLKRMGPQAEADYLAALQLDPKNDGIRYDLADLSFKQKQFAAARQAFVPLQDTPDTDISDLIKYKIFLCDLFGGHEDIAAKELDVFNQVGANASYYFGNAAWNLVHKKPDEAKGWLVSATHIYSEHKQLLYAGILKDMGYLPLPSSSDTN